MITDYLKYSNDKAYVVKREIAIHNFTPKGANSPNMDWLKAWRDHLSCDHVLRTQHHFLLCQTVQDVETLSN
tara:strand:- start:475 stop:690 length:216 start_codon:yes stop_codon:yes gene_type:complete